LLVWEQVWGPPAVQDDALGGLTIVAAGCGLIDVEVTQEQDGGEQGWMVWIADAADGGEPAWEMGQEELEKSCFG